jgi:uncharacterized membrane protein YhaH (DUF805 family)
LIKLDFNTANGERLIKNCGLGHVMSLSDGTGVNLTDSVQVGHNAIGPTTGDIIINSGSNHEICSMCKTPIDAVNNPGLFCFKDNCGTLFCTNCESFFRESRKAGEKPYCADHIGEANNSTEIPPPPSVGAIVNAVLRDSNTTSSQAQPPQPQIIGSVRQQVPFHTGSQVFVDPQNPMGMGQMNGYNPYLNQRIINPIQAFVNTISNWSGRGRAQRSEFWFGMLSFYLLFGLSIGASMVLFQTNGIDEDILISIGCGMFVFLIPLISLMVRRIQDTGNSGWWILLVIIPYIGSLVLLIFAVLPSQAHPNQYDQR